MRMLLLNLVIVGFTTIYEPGAVWASESIVINEFDVRGPSQFVELYGGVSAVPHSAMLLWLCSPEIQK